MSLRHIVFVINPHSGVDRQKAILHAINTSLDHKQYSFEVAHTRHAGHGTELARNAAEKGAFAVVAVGGDGSVNDVARGLQGTDTALAILPKGSGNGMARAMGIPLRVAAALEVLNSGRIIQMDIGRANEQMFISNAGAGFDALISEAFSGSTRRGFAVYSWLVTKHLWAYKEHDWEINIDGTLLRERAFMINVANGQQFGYNFKIAPNASYTDGWLDVTIIKPFPRIMGSSLLIRGMSSSIHKSPYVKTFRAKQVTIAHPDLKLMQTDGDAHICNGKIEFSIKPGALKVIVPAGR